MILICELFAARPISAGTAGGYSVSKVARGWPFVTGVCGPTCQSESWCTCVPVCTSLLAAGGVAWLVLDDDPIKALQKVVGLRHCALGGLTSMH